MGKLVHMKRRDVLKAGILGGAGLAAAAGLGLPVVFTEQVPAKLGPTAPTLLALAPSAPVFGKDSFSALAEEAVRAELLDQRQVSHLLRPQLDGLVALAEVEDLVAVVVEKALMVLDLAGLGAQVSLLLNGVNHGI